jgi:hypothetical protein
MPGTDCAQEDEFGLYLTSSSLISCKTSIAGWGHKLSPWQWMGMGQNVRHWDHWEVQFWVICCSKFVYQSSHASEMTPNGTVFQSFSTTGGVFSSPFGKISHDLGPFSCETTTSLVRNAWTHVLCTRQRVGSTTELRREILVVALVYESTDATIYATATTLRLRR